MAQHDSRTRTPPPTKTVRTSETGTRRCLRHCGMHGRRSPDYTVLQRRPRSVCEPAPPAPSILFTVAVLNRPFISMSHLTSVRAAIYEGEMFELFSHPAQFEATLLQERSVHCIRYIAIRCPRRRILTPFHAGSTRRVFSQSMLSRNGSRPRRNATRVAPRPPWSRKRVARTPRCFKARDERGY